MSAPLFITSSKFRPVGPPPHPPGFVNNLDARPAGPPGGGRKPSLIEFVNHAMIYESAFAFVAAR